MKLLMFIFKYISLDDTNKMYLIQKEYQIRKSKIWFFFLKHLHESLMKKNCAYIPININIKAVFPHGLSGIFISQKAKIGKNCVIFQHVTIGSNMLNDTKHKGAPQIGNNVYICAGAKIIGNIHVGDNVRVGANAVVYEDIPPNSTVVLSNSRIICKDYILDNRFFDISLYKGD